MTHEQARRRAEMLRHQRTISPLPPDEEDWLWDYEHGFLVLVD